MTEQEVQSIKEQVFGQSSTHTLPPVNDVPPVDITPVAEVPPVDVTPITPATNVDTIPVDDKLTFLKENLGFETVEQAKAVIAEYNQLKAIPAPEPVKYANDESKKVHELLLAGKVKEVKAIYDLQEKLEGVESLTPEAAIKFHIEQSNKHYSKDDIQDVFEEKYTYPEKPVIGDMEEEPEFKAREDKYKVSVEKINRRIERDSKDAKDALSKLKTEIVLPEIQKTESQLAYENSLQDSNATKEFLELEKTEFSKLSPQDAKYSFKFNDEANKLAFDINFEPDKETFGKAVENASDLTKFISNFYKEDGSPQRNELLKVIYAGQNIDKIVTEAIVQATNQTKIWFLKNQKNITETGGKNFNNLQPSEVDLLRQQVFGNKRN